MRSFDDGAGCPCSRLNDVLVAIGIELRADELQAAVTALDDGSGHFKAEAFFGWLRHTEPAATPKVHPSVAAGLKEDGDLDGPGLAYDPEQ